MTATPTGPTAHLMPARGLPYGAILVPYLGPKRGYGPAGFAQYNDPTEREIHLAGVRGALALAYQAAQSAGDNIPARPVDFYVCTLDNGQQREIGFLSQIRGNPYPPFIWAGQGVGSRPTLSATGAGAIAVGNDPAPVTFATAYLAPLLGQAWGPWTTLGPMPYGRLMECVVACRQVLKAAGISTLLEAIMVQKSGTSEIDPLLSGVRPVALLERRDPGEEEREEEGREGARLVQREEEPEAIEISGGAHRASIAPCALQGRPVGCHCRSPSLPLAHLYRVRPGAGGSLRRTAYSSARPIRPRRPRNPARSRSRTIARRERPRARRS